MAEPEKQDKVRVDSQQAVVSTLPESLSDDYRNKFGRLLNLTKEQKERLKRWLKKQLSDWQQDTATLHRILEEDNDLVEGIVTETTFPWVGASNVHVPITETYMEVYKSVLRRSILGADNIWYGTTDDDMLLDMVPQIDEMLNYKARNDWNIAETIENTFWPTCRDSVAAMQITWEEEYEPSSDILLISNLDEFFYHFPTSEESGLAEEQWFQLARRVEMEASEDEPLEIPILFEKPVYIGCKGEVVELIDFVTFPAAVPHIKHSLCRGYGKRYKIRRGMIQRKIEDKVFYEEEGKRLIKQAPKQQLDNAFVQAQDRIQGLSRSGNKDEFTVFELVVKGRLFKEGEPGYDEWRGREMKYLVTYSLENDELVQCMDYYYRVDFYALFRINKRPNRLIGKSLPQKTRDLNDEIDTQHNQRINSRTISTVPMFKAQVGAKRELDPMLKESRMGPGRIFWVTDFNTFDQFKIQPTDLGESIQEESNDMKIMDLYLGSATALLSGGVAPGDPSAPGNKTQMMIQQSNLRMDDPLADLREGVAEVGDICLSHLYQFGPPQIQFMAEQDSLNGLTRQTRTLHKKYLRRGLKMNMRGVTVTQNPEVEMQRLINTTLQLMQEPTFAQNPTARVDMWRRALRAGRVPNYQDILPTPDQIQAQQIEIQKQALMQMQQEQALQEEQAQKDLVDENLRAAQKDLQIKSVARKLAEENLNGAA